MVYASVATNKPCPLKFIDSLQFIAVLTNGLNSIFINLRGCFRDCGLNWSVAGAFGTFKGCIVGQMNPLILALISTSNLTVNW